MNEVVVNRKPALERIDAGPDCSFSIRQHAGLRENIPYWHFHPELELVYVDKGQGKRHIGNHLSYFHNSQLLLIGADLPHHGFSDRLTTRGSETIIQFKPDFLGEHFFDLPEAKAISALFERAKKGVLFTPEIRKVVGPKIKKIVDCTGMERIIRFLEILKDLSETKEYTLLNVDGFAFETSLQESTRIDYIYKHINRNFDRQIPLDEMADVASMTVPSFCRYFKRSTGKTFTRFVNEYRIVQARRLLTETSDSITDICYNSGFNNFSHFNKLFKEFTGKSASQYRSELSRMMQ